ncbi:MAG: 16S rRNA (adenine(1518)-N(6)/adenine(1519)-N(6))-dimethyltransferase RsmA [Syntrophales bacterium]|nr:16S rRNA (adenine(1518)-N(6)/adenine(1519)-N(6))-dimethyltransferase RsmA [Syntrophales bacterium]
MTTPKNILKKHGIRPLKRLGQSFLIDNNITKKIVMISDIKSGEIVVEIGSGLGIMTAMISREAEKVIALEVDKYMVDILREELKNHSNVEIVQTDVLKYDFSSAHSEHPSKKLKVIGNIPYNISSQILFHLIEFRDNISSMILMFQKEVAERITAFPGTKEYGILSVIVSMYAKPSLEMTVPGSCFYPKPNVDSSVLKFTVRQAPLFNIKNPDFFSTVVKTAFSKRRKTLLNNLKVSDLLKASKEDIADILELSGIDSKRRGETLTVEEFGKLSNALLSVKALKI